MWFKVAKYWWTIHLVCISCYHQQFSFSSRSLWSQGFPNAPSTCGRSLRLERCDQQKFQKSDLLDGSWNCHFQGMTGLKRGSDRCQWTLQRGFLPRHTTEAAWCGFAFSKSKMDVLACALLICLLQVIQKTDWSPPLFVLVVIEWTSLLDAVLGGDFRPDRKLK